MNIIKWNDFLHNGISGKRKVALTVGVFDGLHIGHQQLVNGIRSFSAKVSDTETAVFTFTNNPSAFFHPHQFLGNILTIRQKLKLFSAYGIRYVVLIDFSADFSKLTGSGFFSIIGEHIEIEYVCLGKIFHCGRNNDTHSEQVRTMLGSEGIQVEIIEQVPYKTVPVSSTRIRKELLAGNIADVNKMLGRYYELDCNEGISNIRQIIPSDGMYTTNINGFSEEKKQENIMIQNGKINFNNSRRELEKIKAIQFIDRVME
mgnify:CR=1 FL=1